MRNEVILTKGCRILTYLIGVEISPIILLSHLRSIDLANPLSQSEAIIEEENIITIIYPRPLTGATTDIKREGDVAWNLNLGRRRIT